MHMHFPYFLVSPSSYLGVFLGGRGACEEGEFMWWNQSAASSLVPLCRGLIPYDYEDPHSCSLSPTTQKDEGSEMHR